jgi:hypothetical protein
MSDDNSDPRRANKKDQPEKRGIQGGLSASGDSLTRLGSSIAEGASRQISPVQYKRGGKVRKTKMRGKKRAKPRE